MQNDLTPQEIQAILAFLSRADLKGSEAPTFMQCVEKLQMLLQKQQQEQAPQPQKVS